MTKTFVYLVDAIVPNRTVDEAVIRLRRAGYTAYAETHGDNRYVVTDGSRLAVSIHAGHGLFLAPVPAGERITPVSR